MLLITDSFILYLKNPPPYKRSVPKLGKAKMVWTKKKIDKYMVDVGIDVALPIDNNIMRH